jgi:hypothetical protein
MAATMMPCPAVHISTAASAFATTDRFRRRSNMHSCGFSERYETREFGSFGLAKNLIQTQTEGSA